MEMTDTNERNTPQSGDTEKQAGITAGMKNWLKSDAFKCIMMDIGASLIILVIFFCVCVPKKYDLTVSSIAPETIKATKDVIDEVTTQALREEAGAAVKIKYTDITDDLLLSLDNAFEELRTIRLRVFPGRNQPGCFFADHA